MSRLTHFSGRYWTPVDKKRNVSQGLHARKAQDTIPDHVIKSTIEDLNVKCIDWKGWIKERLYISDSKLNRIINLGIKDMQQRTDFVNAAIELLSAQTA